MLRDHSRQEPLKPTTRTMRKILMIIPVLVIAIVSYTVTVYAWFQASIVNSGNAIAVGQYQAKVEILDANSGVLWSSSEGVNDLDSTITLPGNYTGEATLCVRCLESSTVAFKYQIELTVDSISLLSAVPSTEEVLEPGIASKNYEITIPEGTTELRLQFHTAFKDSTSMQEVVPGLRTSDSHSPVKTSPAPAASEISSGTETVSQPSSVSTSESPCVPSNVTSGGETESQPSESQTVSTSADSGTESEVPGGGEDTISEQAEE